METVNIITKLSHGLPTVDILHVVKLVDELGLYGAARVMGYDIAHYNNLLMAGRLAIESLKESAPKTLLEYSNVMVTRLNKETYDFINLHHLDLQASILKNEYLDYDHDWFSANTMITMYSANAVYGQPGVETPQYTWMRIAIQLYHTSGVSSVIRAYEEMSTGWYTPASPTIFNAGMRDPQMASCFLVTIDDDLESILKTGIYRGGMISKSSGGLGFDISRVRHSEIRETGWSNGIVPMLQLYNYMLRYVDQNGRRKGAATVFLRPHHIDVEDFIDLPRKVGDKYARAHDLNICLWTSWIFWDRIQSDGIWTLFCPARVPQLNDLYGKDFTDAYILAESDPSISDRHKKVVKARDLYRKICDVQRETGMPYLMNGDAANIKSNHRHMGYIRCSNLCLEIIEYTDEQTIAVCNLHSISLRMFADSPINITDTTIDGIQKALCKAVNFDKLSYISGRVIQNLNKVIDHNWYPLDKIKNGVLKPNIINLSNKRHRPVGMGVAGFAELLHILDLPFEDEAVGILNKMLFACMYWNAVAASIQLSIYDGTYESFPGSPTSEGLLQFDLWKEEFKILGPNKARKAEDDDPIEGGIWGQKEIKLYGKDKEEEVDTIKPTWKDLKRCMVKYGLRNSLLLANMPTASTAQIRRNCESVEAHQNNMYSRKVLKCSYPVLNRYLVGDLEKENVWNDAAVEYIRFKNGSVQGLTNFVANNKNLFGKFTGNIKRLEFVEKKYKTMWEISQKVLMKLAADRGRYIDQSSSSNIYLRDCTNDQIRAAHLYANMLGLKTIMYYLRQTGGETIKFTADPVMTQYIKGVNVDTNVDTENKKESSGKIVCTDEVCVSCT